jgi:hypothetical protein
LISLKVAEAIAVAIPATFFPEVIYQVYKLNKTKQQKMITKKNLLIIFFIFSTLIGFAQKPLVWIYTDMSDGTLKGPTHMGTVNDPDDISAMAGYLLMCNEFETLGIVVASTHRKEHVSTPHQGEWANNFFGKAYADDLPGLNKNIGGYPGKIKFTQSCIKESAERFSMEKNYTDLSKYSTVKTLFDVAKKQKDTINVLCWGSLTEPAILVKHCIETGETEILKKLRFIAHWTNSSWHQGSIEHPENVANCREDANACGYMKEQAFAGKIVYHELGAIGQHGIVSGCQIGSEYYNQFKTSALGKIYAEGKFVHNGVDDSDGATYWTLPGKWGVSLKDVPSNGTNSPEIEKANEVKFFEQSKTIHDELLRRAKLAAGN